MKKINFFFSCTALIFQTTMSNSIRQVVTAEKGRTDIIVKFVDYASLPSNDRKTALMLFPHNAINDVALNDARPLYIEITNETNQSIYLTPKSFSASLLQKNTIEYNARIRSFLKKAGYTVASLAVLSIAVRLPLVQQLRPLFWPLALAISGGFTGMGCIADKLLRESFERNCFGGTLTIPSKNSAQFIIFLPKNTPIDEPISLIIFNNINVPVALFRLKLATMQPLFKGCLEQAKEEKNMLGKEYNRLKEAINNSLKNIF